MTVITQGSSILHYVKLTCRCDHNYKFIFNKLTIYYLYSRLVINTSYCQDKLPEHFCGD